jgi:hypothetical protein
MTDTPAELDSPGASRVDRRWQIAGYAVGVLLFGAAIGAVVVHRDVLVDAVASVRGAPAWLVLLALALPLANWLVVSVSLWVLTRAYGRVGLGEMTALIANAWMLNYLPMRPGMLGRVTYHKVVNGIRVRDSARVIVYATALSATSNVVLGAIAVALRDSVGAVGYWIALSLPFIACAVAIPLVGDRPTVRRLLVAMILRHVDMLAWIGRYWAVFALLDVRIGIAGAVAMAVVSQIALLIPFTGNGLGVREWFIGQTAALLPAGVIAGADQMALGLAADLVNRAAELAVSLPVGLAAAWWLTRRLTRLSGRPRADSADESDPGSVGVGGVVDPTDG